MPGIIARIKAFTRSPQGQRAIAQARAASADPRKREQARRLFGKLRGGRR
ncbi:hypothetical protein OG875_29045 [Streptomyces sp. NBC_01498]|nr:hypothetical protein [Streptomyces sp. NBC_01498]WTL28277.1 hypothetical protein OG875_29045 [Streptomyces sp. NBC_01498]